jgi:hypothetical protein
MVTNLDDVDSNTPKDAIDNLKIELKQGHKSRYPMSHLLEAGLLVLQVEGKNEV